MSGPRAWSISIKDEIENTRRRFDSVKWRNVPLPWWQGSTCQRVVQVPTMWHAPRVPWSRPAPKAPNESSYLSDSQCSSGRRGAQQTLRREILAAHCPRLLEACLARNAAMLISCADLYDGRWILSCQVALCNSGMLVKWVLVGGRYFNCFDRSNNSTSSPSWGPRLGNARRSVADHRLVSLTCVGGELFSCTHRFQKVLAPHSWVPLREPATVNATVSRPACRKTVPEERSLHCMNSARPS